MIKYLTFNNEMDRAQHPQAKLISRGVWQTFFNSKLTDRELNLLKNGINDFSVDLNLSYDESLKLLICSLLSKKYSRTEELFNFAKNKLNLSDESIFKSTYLTGNLQLINKIKNGLSAEQIKTIITDNSRLITESLIHVGHIAQLNLILDFNVTTTKTIKDLFTKDDYCSFYKSALETGDLNLAKYLEGKFELTNKDVKSAIKSNDSEAYCIAVCKGHIDILKYFETKFDTDEIKNAFNSDDYRAYQSAVENGHLNVLEYFESKFDTDEIKKAFNSSYYRSYKLAAENGHLNVLKYFKSKIDISNMTFTQYYNFEESFDDSYQSAAENGHLNVLKYFESMFDTDDIKSAFNKDYYKAYQSAAENGHLNVLKYFESKFDTDEIKQAFNSLHYRAYQLAAENGHLNILKYFESKFVTNDIKNAFNSDDYIFYQSAAAANGHLDVLNYFESKVDMSNMSKTATESFYDSYQSAAENGHLNVLKYFESKVDMSNMNKTATESFYKSYQLAAANGHLDILKYFESKVDVSNMNKTATESFYESYQLAAANGHLDILKYFKDKFGLAKIKSAFKSNKPSLSSSADYAAFFYAAESCHLDILKYFEEVVDANEIKNAFALRGFWAFQRAISDERLDILKYFKSNMEPDDISALLTTENGLLLVSVLGNESIYNIIEPLQYVDCFDPVESNDAEYGAKYIYPYVSNKLNKLHQSQMDFSQDNPNGVFSIEADDAPLWFYILRNLIRRNDDSLQADIDFLINIPEIKNFLYLSVNSGEFNELLSLAESIHNTGAIESLGSITALITLGQGNYNESSMRSLNQNELKIVDNVKYKISINFNV